MNRDGFISRTSRLTAIVYIIGAIIGLILSTGGLIGLWTTKAAFTTQVNEAVSLAGRALEASSGTVEVAGHVLDRTAENLKLIHQMIGDLSDTIGSSSGMLTNTSKLVGTDMVEFVKNAQTSLDSLQTSGKLIDDFLRVVSRVPFVGKQYQPEVPLEEGFARISRSMEPLDDTFLQMKTDLDRSSASAATLKVQLEQLNKQVDTIQTELDNGQKLVTEYKSILDRAQNRYDRFNQRLPGILNAVYLLITALLLWMLITQAGMLLHGWEMLR